MNARKVVNVSAVMALGEVLRVLGARPERYRGLQEVLGSLGEARGAQVARELRELEQRARLRVEEAELEVARRARIRGWT